MKFAAPASSVLFCQPEVGASSVTLPGTPWTPSALAANATVEQMIADVARLVAISRVQIRPGARYGTLKKMLSEVLKHALRDLLIDLLKSTLIDDGRRKARRNVQRVGDSQKRPRGRVLCMRGVACIEIGFKGIRRSAASQYVRHILHCVRTGNAGTRYEHIRVPR